MTEVVKIFPRVVNIMGADVLAMQGARTPVIMTPTMLNRNTSVLHVKILDNELVPDKCQTTSI